MAFLGNIFKRNQNQPLVLDAPPQMANPVVSGAQQAANNAQVVDQTPPQVDTTATVDPVAVQNAAGKMQGIKNALSKLAPSNWDDTTNQKVMLLSQFLSGFGGTPYDSNKSQFGNIAQGVSNGAVNAQKSMGNYQGYQMAKDLYSQFGLDPKILAPYGDYSKMTPEMAISLGIKQKQNEVRLKIQNEKDKTTKTKMIFDAVNKGYMTPEEAQIQLKSLDFEATLQESNDTRRTNDNTRKTDSQIEVNKARITKIKADISQNAQKIKILQQKVNQGAASQADKDLLRKLNIENKKLIIEQNTLINQAMKEQLGNGGGGGGGGNPRPVGSKGNGVKVF